jgi:hypothetical protein
LESTQVVKTGKEFFKNAIEDVKSGKIYNTERTGYNDELSDLDTMFGDIDEYFDDEDESSADVNIQNNVVNDSKSADATIKVVQQQTEYQLKSSKATVDTMVSVGSATIMKVSEIGTQLLSELNTINSNLAAMVEYNNTNMTKFIEASIGYYEQMSAVYNADDKYSSTSSRVTADNIYGSGGGLDFSNYKEYIKGNIAKMKDESMTGNMLSMLLENKEMITSNPLGFLIKGSMESLIPSILKESMKAVDESIKDFIPIMLERIGSLGEDETGSFASISKVIGKVFGTKTESKTEFDTSKITKGPIPYNGVANHTITEIIPKYLRESNTYLKEIASVITGKSDNEFAKGFTGFDWDTGKFKSMEEIESNIYDSMVDSVVSRFERSKGGKALESYGDVLASEKDRTEYNDVLRHVYTSIEKQKGEIDYSNSESISKILDGINMSKVVRTTFEEAFKDLQSNDHSAIGSLKNTKIAATRDKNKQMKFLEENASENGLYGIDNTEGAYDRYTAKRASEGVSVGEHSTRSVSMSVPTILQGIQNTLNRGIYVQIKNFDSSTSTTPESATGAAIDTNAAANEPTQTDEEIRNAIAQKHELDNLYDDDELYNSSTGITGKVSKGMMSFKKVLDGIMAGDADAAWDSFMGGVKNVFAQAGGFLSEHFLNPIKKSLFGDKDENGYLKGGIFEGVNNRMKESFYSLRRMITGKGYIDAEGNKVNDATEEEMGNTVAGKLKNLVENTKQAISVRLFGEKDEESGEVKKEGIFGKAKTGISTAASSLMAGLNGWNKALFGESNEEDPEKGGKEVLENLKQKANEMLPSAITGSIVGAGAGALSGGILGTLVGGPLGGSILGFAGGILSKSEKFQNWLFGKEIDDEGNRAGGFISKETQEFMKKNSKFLIGGTVLGAVKGGITGGGILGTLVGGPIAGALMGLGTSIIIKSDTFQKFLFGDEKEGQLGLVTLVKKAFNGFGQKEGKASGGKLGGMLAIGAGTGAITASILSKVGVFGAALGAGGPIGGAILGLGAAMLAQKDNFHEWLFGKTDEETGTKREGILGQFKNTIKANVLNPMSDQFKTIGADFKRFLKYDVFQKFNLAIEPITEGFSNWMSSVSEKLGDITAGVGNFIRTNFLQKGVELLGNMLSPIQEASSAIATAAYNVGKMVIAAPINLLSALTSPIAIAVRKGVKTVTSTVGKVLDTVVVKPIGNLIIKPAAMLTGKLLKGLSLPFKALGVAAQKVSDLITGPVAHVAKFATTIVTDAFISAGKVIGNVIAAPFRVAKNATNLVKSALSIAVKPLTIFVKSALTEVKDALKTTIGGFFSKAFGLIAKPFKSIRNFIGNGVKSLFGGKKDGSKLGYFGRIWRQTGIHNDNVDNSDTLERDENGNVIGSNLSKAERERNRKANNRAAKARNKEEAAERREHTRNSKLINKYTKGQRVDDTEENRQLAELMSGKKISFKGKAKETDTQKVKAAINEQTKETVKSNNWLEKIYHTIAARLGNKDSKEWLKNDQENERKVKAEKAAQKAEEERIAKEQADKKKNIGFKAWFLKGYRNHVKPTEEDTISAEEAAAVNGEGRGASLNYDAYSKNSARKQKRAQTILNQQTANNINSVVKGNGVRGLFGRLKNGFNVALDEVKSGIATARVNKHEDGTDSAKAGLAIVGEAGPEAMYSKNSKFGKLVGLHGPEVVNMKGGETVIPNSKLPRFEDGTDDNKEFDHSKVSDKNLVKETDSTKLSIGERIIRELLAIKVKLTNLNIPFFGDFDEPEKPEETENATINAPDENATNILDASVSGTTGAISSVISDTFAKQEKAENKKRLKDIENKERQEKDESKQASVSTLTGDNNRARNEALREEESDDDREDAKLAALQNLVSGQKSHNSVWNSIFSKKGLITGGLLVAFPFLLKLLKNLPSFLSNLPTYLINGINGIIDGVKTAISDAVSQISFIINNHALTDGETTEEKIEDNIDDLSNGNILSLQDDGSASNQTSARAKLLARVALNNSSKIKTAANVVKGGASLATSAVKGTVGLGTKAAKSIGTALSNTKTISDLTLEYGDEAYELASNGVQKVAAKVYNKAANSKVATKAAEAATSLKSSKGGQLLTKVCDYIKTFFNTITEKFTKKTGKTVGASAFGEFGPSKIVKMVKDKWNSIADKISKKLGIKGGADAVTAGVAEVAFVTCGAINGASGTAKLFHVDKSAVDSKMTTISTIFGAIASSTAGSIIDVVAQLVYDVTGYDFLCTLATVLYNAWASDEDAAKLEDAKSAFQDAYVDYQSAQVEQQYNTQKAAGLIDSDMSYDDYVEAVNNGDITVSYDSFADYNTKQNASISDKIFTTLGKGAKAVGKGAKAVLGAVVGSKKEYYTDANGNTYTKNDDGTYEITSSTGEDLGFINEKEIPDDAELITEKKDGIIQKVGNALSKGVTNVKNFLFSHTDSAWYDTDGSYYLVNGDSYDHYSGSGDLIEESVDADEVQAMITSGALLEGEVKVNSGLKTGLTKIGSAIKSNWDKFVEKITPVYSSVEETITTTATNAANRLAKRVIGVRDFLLDHTEKRWYSTEGGYYQSNGTSIDYYNDNGDLITEDISADDFQELCNQGIVTMDDAEEVTINSTFKTKWAEVKKIKSSVFSGLSDTANELWSKLSTTAGTVLSDVKEQGILSYVGGLFKKKSTKGWYTVDGTGYYQYVNYKWNRYNMNGDLIEEDVDDDKVQDLINAGLVTEGDIETDSEAQTAVKEIQSAIKDAWSSAKETVKSGWSSFKSLITGGSGTGTTIKDFTSSSTYNSSDYSISGGSGYGITKQNFIRGGKGNDATTVNGHAYYSQNDSRWANDKYIMSDGTDDGATIADTGCGPTAMSMVVSDMTGKSVNPTEMAQYAQFTGNRDETGTNWNFIDSAASTYGLDSTAAYNPSKNFIESNLKNGNPMILSGQDDGSGNTPYTTAGHYVVAVGVDSNGNVIYNDPRGESYSGRKNIDQFINNTGAAWSFSNTGDSDSYGGSGIRKTSNKIINFHRNGGGRGYDKWLAIVQAVKAAIAAQKPGYDKDKYINITVGGVTKSVRCDCSGLVAACMKYYGVMADSVNLYTGIMLSDTSPMKGAGFTRRTFTSWNDLTPGEVLVCNGHTEIYAGEKDGDHYVYNNGSNGSVNNAGAMKRISANYTTVWTPGNPGSSCVQDVSLSDSSLLSGTTTSSSLSDSSLDMLSQISSGYTKLANAAWQAALTGNYNIDWASVFADSDSSSLLSTDTTSTDSGTTATDGTTTTGGTTTETRHTTKSLPSGLGKSKPYMAWQKITNQSTTQWKLKQSTGMPFDTQGFGKVKDRYAVAMKPYFGDPGDYVDVTLDNGQTIKGIIADLKGNENSDYVYSKYAHGHNYTDSNVVEFVVDENSWYGTDKAVVKYHPEWNTTVKTVDNVGNYFESGGSGKGRKSNSNTAPTIDKRKYVGSENTIFGGNGETDVTEQALQTSIPTQRISTDEGISNLTTTNNYNVDNSTLEGLMSQVVNILTTISSHSNNLDLLKDIKSGINKGSVTLNQTTNNNTTNVSGTKGSQNKVASGTFSSAEMAARQIAFGNS